MYFDILLMKAGDAKEFSPFMCSYCHEAEHKHIPMIMFVGEMFCYSCGRHTNLKELIEKGKPFRFEYLKERWYQDKRPEERIPLDPETDFVVTIIPGINDSGGSDEDNCFSRIIDGVRYFV